MNKKKVLILSSIIISFSIFIFTIIAIQTLLPKELQFSFALIGKVPLCNRNKASALIIGNFVFPLCWRCTFMLLSYILGMILFNLTKLRKKIISLKIIYIILFCTILILPLIIDGSLQYFFDRESNHLRRMLTGSLFGIGISILTTKLISILFDV